MNRRPPPGDPRGPTATRGLLLLAGALVVIGLFLGITRALAPEGRETVDADESARALRRIRERLRGATVEIEDLRRRVETLEASRAAPAGTAPPTIAAIPLPAQSRNAGDADPSGADEPALARDDPRRLARAPSGVERMQVARELLESTSPVTRLAALEALIDGRPAEALDEIQRLVREGEDGAGPAGWLATRALELLAASRDPAAATLLRETFGTRTGPIRLAAARALERLEDDGPMREHLRELDAALRDGDVGTRARAVRQVGRTRSPLAAPALLPMLEDRDSEVRLRALEALLACGDDGTAARVGRLLDDPVALVREQAARTLAALRRRGRTPTTSRGLNWFDQTP